MAETVRELATIAAVVLAVLLVWAAVAKVRAPLETAGNFEQLGVPAPLLMARVVPAVEVVVALLLLAVPGWGGVAAFALLACFTVLLVSLVRSGATVACSCFGTVSDEPISWVEVTRNVVLLMMAALALSIDQLAAPSFAGVVAFSALAVVAGVAVQLVAFKRDVGSIWTTTLAGELTSDDSADHGSGDGLISGATA